MKIAIITGASSGLGRAFVRRLGRDRTLDAIWTIARNEANLRALACRRQGKGDHSCWTFRNGYRKRQ